MKNSKSRLLFTTTSLSFVILGIPGFFLYFGDWPRAIFAIVFAIFLGLLIAPHLEPKYFKSPAKFQAVCGAFGLAAGIYTLFESIDLSLLGIFAGAVLGYFAPLWVDRITIP